MDWKVIASTFGLIFLAEMGDKTQLAAITMVAKTKSPVAVFVGASLALTVVSLFGVAVGVVITQYVPTVYLQKSSAVAFVVIGLLMLVGKL